MRGATIFLTSCSLVFAGCAETQEIHVRAVGAPAAKSQYSGGLLAVGRGQLALGNAGTALETFRKLLREQPESPDAFAGVAACYVAMGRYDLARTNYEFALAYTPNDVGLLTALASSLDRLGEIGQAAGIRREVASMRAASAALAETQAPAVTPIAVPRLASVTVRLPAAAPAPPVQKVAEPEIAKPALWDAPLTLAALQPAILKTRFDTEVSIAIPTTVPDQALAQEIVVPQIEEPVLSTTSVTLPSLRPAILKNAAFDTNVLIAIPATMAVQTPEHEIVAPEIGKPVLSMATVALSSLRLSALEPRPLAADLAIAIAGVNELSPERSNPPTPRPLPVEKPREVAVAQAEPQQDGSPYLTRSSPGVVSLITRPAPVWVAQATPMARVRAGRASATLQEAAKIAQAQIASNPVPGAVRWMPLKYASAPANVRLLNAARSQSLAARMRSTLLDRGWRKIAIGNARETRLRSLVLFTPARAAIARRLAAHFGCKAVKVQGADRVIVLLGRDAISRKQGIVRA